MRTLAVPSGISHVPVGSLALAGIMAANVITAAAMAQNTLIIKIPSIPRGKIRQSSADGNTSPAVTWRGPLWLRVARAWLLRWLSACQ
jgi:hypothetical protein